jgi:hypothetical protein
MLSLSSTFVSLNKTLLAATDKIPNIFLSYCWKEFKTFILCISFLSLILQTGCNKKHIDSQEWYNDTKAEILKQANLNADSITYTFDKDSIWFHAHLFSKGHLFRDSSRKRGDWQGGADSYYSTNGEFIFGREICPNDTILSEGIVYKGACYGLSTWWAYCDKRKLMEQGIRYNGEKIGIWKYWDYDGTMTTKDYGNIDKLDSMPSIFKQ